MDSPDLDSEVRTSSLSDANASSYCEGDARSRTERAACKFRTVYALAAPEYNMHDALGLNPEKLDFQSCRVPTTSLPGRSMVPFRNRRFSRTKSDLQPIASRWWLRDVKQDMSWGEGLYEVVSGLVPLHGTPDRHSPRLGALRAGTRFRAVPHLVGNASWLSIVTEGTNALLFSLDAGGHATSKSNASTRRRQSTGLTPAENDRFNSLYLSGRVDPLSPGSMTSPQDPLDVLREASTDLWVENNLQYIIRRRDIDREKGLKSYSVCSFSGVPIGRQRRS
mmetsp:Transcript_46123/g.128270  ORF Transcript_46123/g.128270 Transcript_46123/m.128270 type:complete len:279 (+) Transcript_46123:34-870(+)